MVKGLDQDLKVQITKLGLKTTIGYLNMGSVTNLKENKTLFILCDCHSEVLVIEYDHELMMADLAIYENYSSFNHKMSLWQRIRYCWRVLWHRKPYTDQLMLSAKQIQDLRLFLNQIDL